MKTSEGHRLVRASVREKEKAKDMERSQTTTNNNNTMALKLIGIFHQCEPTAPKLKCFCFCFSKSAYMLLVH